MHSGNPEVVSLAGLIDRSANSVALRLSNFASLDPALRVRGIRGMANSSRLDQAVWEAYLADPEEIAFESEAVVEALGGESLLHAAQEALPEVGGQERLSLIRARVNQWQFRRTILARYDGRCCVTGLDLPELLVAAHIVPWAVDAAQRMNPQNGLCLNALHDRAFESGIIVIDDDLRIRVTDADRLASNEAARQLLLSVDGRPLILQGDIEPDRDLLRWHRERFR